jgi:general stress protein YciG
MKQQSYRGGAGNFANDPERAKEAGRAGGKASGGKFRNAICFFITK